MFCFCSVQLIPAKVVKEHKLTLGKRLHYIDEQGSLKGKKAKYKDGRTCRYIGFDKITKRNSLKAGDTITCNLLHTRKLEILSHAITFIPEILFIPSESTSIIELLESLNIIITISTINTDLLWLFFVHEYLNFLFRFLLPQFCLMIIM